MVTLGDSCHGSSSLADCELGGVGCQTCTRVADRVLPLVTCNSESRWFRVCLERGVFRRPETKRNCNGKLIYQVKRIFMLLVEDTNVCYLNNFSWTSNFINTSICIGCVSNYLVENVTVNIDEVIKISVQIIRLTKRYAISVHA